MSDGIDHEDYTVAAVEEARLVSELRGRIKELEEECNLHVADFHSAAGSMFRYREALSKIAHHGTDCPLHDDPESHYRSLCWSLIGIAHRALNRETR